METSMDNSNKLLYTWFGNSHKFDYVHRLVISFYIFKVLVTPKEPATSRALDLLWDCMMNQTFKPKMRAIYLVNDEVRKAQLKFATEYDLVIQEISRLYPELLIHMDGGSVTSTMNTKQVEKSTKKFIIHLNQFMVSMKVAYKYLPEPERFSQCDSPDWIVTMLKVFNGKSNEREWFEFVINELKCDETEMNNSEKELVKLQRYNSTTIEDTLKHIVNENYNNNMDEI
jgi:hypothetical protein